MRCSRTHALDAQQHAKLRRTDRKALKRNSSTTTHQNITTYKGNAPTTKCTAAGQEGHADEAKATTEKTASVATSTRSADTERSSSRFKARMSSCFTSATASCVSTAMQRHVRSAGARMPLSQLKPGSEHRDVLVVGVQPFGIFVDIGAERDGLLHASALHDAAALQSGDRLAVVVVQRVHAGRLTLTLQRPSGSGTRAAAGGRQHVQDGRASRATEPDGGTSATASETASRSSSSSSLTRLHRSNATSTSRATSSASRQTEAERLAALTALQREIDASPDHRFRDGEVRSVAPFGAFVRLQPASADKLARRPGSVAAAADASAAFVDGLLSASALEAAYRAGFIGAAGTAHGIAPAQLVRVHVDLIDMRRRRVALSLCEPRLAIAEVPTRLAMFPALVHESSIVATALPTSLPSPSPPPPVCTLALEQGAAPSAASLFFAECAPMPRATHEPRVLLIRKFCRCQAQKPDRFRTITLVSLPWKDELAPLML